MKVETEITGAMATKILATVAVGFVIGFVAATMTMQPAAPAAVATDCLKSVDCLTTADLSKEDIAIGSFQARFCEGLGMQSSVYWQQDPEGNTFGTPICLPPEEQ